MSSAAAALDYLVAARLEEVPADSPLAVEVSGRAICLLRVERRVIAFEDRCPHRGHALSKGKCIGGVLRCALHGWEFGLPGGAAVSPRAPFGLELIESRVVNDEVQVCL